MVSLGNLRLIVTDIESPTALPIFCIFIFKLKLLSATEIMFGLIFTNGSSITKSGLGKELILIAGSACKLISSTCIRVKKSREGLLPPNSSESDLI